MKAESIIKVLKLLGATVPSGQHRPGWIISDCVLGPWRHDHGKSNPTAFGVKVEAGLPFCSCFSCDWHTDMGSLVLEMRHLNKIQPAREVDWKSVNMMLDEADNELDLNLDAPDIEDLILNASGGGLHEFPEWWLSSFAPVDEVEWAQTYLSVGRAGCDPVPQSVAHALDLRCDTNQGRICFPVRSFSGKLMGLHGRAVQAAVEPRYRMYLQAGHNNPIVWLGESWVDLQKPIVVVEGPFDLASVYRVYRNVVSPLFSTPNAAKLQRMSDAFEWFTLLDRGKGGDKGREKIANIVGKDHLLKHLFPPVSKKDPGEMGVGELVDLLEPCVKLDPILD